MKVIAIVLIFIILGMVTAIVYLYRCYYTATEALIKANRRIRNLEDQIGAVSDNAIQSIDKENSERRRDFFDLNFRLNRIEDALHVPKRIEEFAKGEYYHD